MTEAGLLPLSILKQHSSYERVSPFGASPTQSQCSLTFVNGEGKEGVWRSLKPSDKYRRQSGKDDITPFVVQPWHLHAACNWTISFPSR